MRICNDVKKRKKKEKTIPRSKPLYTHCVFFYRIKLKTLKCQIGNV